MIHHIPIGFTGNPLDRAGERRKDAGWLTTRMLDPASRAMISWRGKPLLSAAGDGSLVLTWLPMAEARREAEPEAILFLGLYGEAACFVLALDDALDVDVEADGPWARYGRFTDLRTEAARMPGGDGAIAAQARTLLQWHKKHGYCSNCGAPTDMAEAGYKRVCGACATEHFPRVDPSVIMTITHGGKLLLGRGKGWPGPMYSALAGFIDPGETIEEAVKREAFEEAGVVLTDIRYLASAPWPFPSSLMIGCTARAESDEVVVDRTELDDARWFSREEIADILASRGAPGLLAGTADGPWLPPPSAIANPLIRLWLEQR